MIHTIGQRQGLAKVMVKEAIMTGRKSNILGYISKGDRVWKKKKNGIRKSKTIYFTNMPLTNDTKNTHTRCDDNRLKSLKDRFNGN